MKLEEIDKLLGEITQGDWGVDARVGCLVVSSTGRAICSTRTSHNNKRDPEEQEAEQAANADFIAAAPTIIKELVERIRTLQTELNRADRIIGENIHPG